MGSTRRELDRLKTECDLRADIVGLIANFVELRTKGREMVGLCPFHDDHNPSMCVVPAKQIFHCFSCGAGGDQYTFVRRFHSLDFPDAIREVARVLGISTDGKEIVKGATERRESKKAKPPELMSAGQILDEWSWYKEHAYPHEDWAKKLDVDPRAMELTKMVAAPYKANQACRVLVCPMRNAEGVLCSLRFRDFETKKRWSLDRKEKIDGRWERTGGTRSGVMTIEDTFDTDICLDGTKDLVVEGETDLLGGITIMLREFDLDPATWPVRIIALPGVNSCHDLLLAMPLSRTVITFFDLDGAGFLAAFNHRRMKVIHKPNGERVAVPDRDAPFEPGLISKLQEQGKSARACFPPTGSDGLKYDLRDMGRDGVGWSDLYRHLINNSTADPYGKRIRRHGLAGTTQAATQDHGDRLAQAESQG